MVESVDESIDVITLFQGGQLIPVRFKWRDRVIKVRQVTGDWTTTAGRDRIHYFSVLGDSADYFEIAYHTRNTSWRLTRVWMDG